MAKKFNKKVVAAMSGGVDSSVAAFLLREKFEVTGMYLRLGTEGEEKSERAARAVCRKLKIPFYPVNLAQIFEKEVIDYFLKSYQTGLTPNPCIRCNRLIKFGELLKRGRELGADYLATGHYARLRREFPISNFQFSIKLFKAKDTNKDQTYFLYTLSQKQLNFILFPLGGMAKTEVRKIADQAGLPYLEKESQDVCFLHDEGRIVEHNDFLKKHLKLKPGPIVLNPSAPPAGGASPLGKGRGQNRGGRKAEGYLGMHQGLPLYTVGQRKGIEIGGTGPFYVARADYRTNTLYVVNSFNDPALFSLECLVRDANWVAGQEPKLPLVCKAVIRYRHAPVECAVSRNTQHATHNTQHATCNKRVEFSYMVKFKEAQRAVTPGQSVVFYRGDEVIGGGIIELIIKN